LIDSIQSAQAASSTRSASATKIAFSRALVGLVDAVNTDANQLTVIEAGRRGERRDRGTVNLNSSYTASGSFPEQVQSCRRTPQSAVMQTKWRDYTSSHDVASKQFKLIG
jgi:hypothetical protein